MIVKGDEFERNFAQLSAHIFIFLFHGTDLGLIHERAKRAARGTAASADPFELIQITGDQIAANPGLLADEAASIGLFGDKRVIWIEAGAKSFNDALIYQLENPPENCTIVIEAGTLKPTSPLRKLLDPAKRAASVGCYADNAEDLRRLVQATVQQHGLTIEPEIRDQLVARLGNDRLITRSELEKLCLYALGEKQISWQHITDIMNDASAIALEEAIDAAFQGQRIKVEQNCTRVFETGGDSSYLLISALSHALRLHRIRLELDNGGNLESLLMRNGIFYQRKQMVTGYLGRWRADSLQAAVKLLQDCISRARQQPKLANILAVRTLWTVAGLAVRR